jgi:ribosomal protein S7
MKVQKKSFYYKDFYRVIDGYYSSYWSGKFTNNYVLAGRKTLVENEMNKVYLYMKLYMNLLALEVLLEKVEKIKPTFKLKSVTIAGKKREFPVFLAPEKQRSRAIRNIKDIVSKRKEWYLNQRIINEMVDLRTIKNHELMKQRDESLRDALKNRFNMRYAY